MTDIKRSDHRTLNVIGDKRHARRDDDAQGDRKEYENYLPFHVYLLALHRDNVNRFVSPAINNKPSPLITNTKKGGIDCVPPFSVQFTNYFLTIGGVGIFVSWHSVQFCCAVIPTSLAGVQFAFETYLPSFQAFKS